MPNPDGMIENRDVADKAITSRLLDDDLTLGGKVTTTTLVVETKLTVESELVIPALTSDPVSPADGNMWLHTVDNALYIWEGGAKRTVASW